MNTPHSVIPGFCIVDMFDRGILVYCDEKRAYPATLPPDALSQAHFRMAVSLSLPQEQTRITHEL